MNVYLSNLVTNENSKFLTDLPVVLVAQVDPVKK